MLRAKFHVVSSLLGVLKLVNLKSASFVVIMLSHSYSIPNKALVVWREFRFKTIMSGFQNQDVFFGSLKHVKENHLPRSDLLMNSSLGVDFAIAKSADFTD